MQHPVDDPDVTAEYGLLMNALYHPDDVLAYSESIQVTDFGSLFTRACWAVISRSLEDGEPIDEVILRKKLKAKGDWGSDWHRQFCQMLEFVPNQLHIRSHVGELRDTGTKRQLLVTCKHVIADVMGGTSTGVNHLSSAIDSLIELANDRDTGTVMDAKQLMQRTFADVEKRSIQYQKGEQCTIGIKTGFAPLDRLLTGLEPNTLFILAARPSMGKTALAIQMAMRMAKDVPVLFHSVEMGSAQIGNRIAGQVSKVPLSRIRDGRIERLQWNKLAEGIAEASQANLVVDDTASLTLSRIRSRVVRLRALEGQLGAVFIDYLQLMRPPRQPNREREIATLSAGLKQIARDYSVPVIVLSQLNRGCEMRENKRPRLSDLRDSGAIEQDADIVAFVYRDEYYNDATDEPGIAEVNVAKNRNGPTGTCKLKWDGETTSFGW